MITAFLLALLFAGPAAAARDELPAYVRAEWPWRTGGCQSTRTRILIRDAERVEMDAPRCKVLGGAWRDPYTGALIDSPKRLDVDHVVPLAWAHAHGGARWERERKIAFANDLGYRFHLRAVDLRENRGKGNAGPALWSPPDPAAACQYGQAWAVILITWDLDVDAGTRAAIRRLVGQC